MARNYNFIYKELVENENDVVGHIAYSIYKSAKVEFIERFKENHEGKDPTEEDFQQFHESCCVSANLDGYKSQAMTVLKQFLDDTLSSMTKQMEEDYIKKQDEHLEKIVKPLTPNFWSGVKQSVVGAFVFAILLLAFAYIYRCFGSDLEKVAGHDSKNIMQKAETPDTTRTYYPLK